MKNRIVLLTFLLPLLLFFGCNNVKSLDMNSLTRVDIQASDGEGGYSNNEFIITKEESIKLLREILSKIHWEENVKVQWSRFEDTKATLFFDVDKNMPETLVEYFIWFEENGTATFSQKDEHRLGKLDKENTRILRELISNE